MKNLQRTRELLALSGLVAAVTAVGALSLPTGTAGYAFLGGSLSLSQRDFRVFDNFTDATANDNTTPHANFPGQTGATMAIWKAHAEWGSGPYAGNGQGDTGGNNPNIGDGGANFDNTFQGPATVVGGVNDNIHSEIISGGGALAYVEIPISDGWRTRYISSWTWQDGPGTVPSGIDIQGIACSEIGHTLGLDHSSVAGVTMTAFVSGTGISLRSIEADDKAGIQALYGVKSASKPVITSLGGSQQLGQTLVINGSNFSATNNEVWFTKTSSDGNPSKVTGVASSGTSLSVSVPANAADGEVLVKNDGGTGGANLSNAFPIDIGGGGGGQFINIGPGLAGLFGVPVLTGVGDLTPGGGGFTLTTTGGLPNAQATMFFSLSQGAVPFKGGTFYPSPIFTLLAFVADGGGMIVLPAQIPAGIPSATEIVCQTWLADIFAIQDLSATNGLKLVVP